MSGATSLAVAAIQLNSAADKPANLAAGLAMIDRAAASGARLIALPEVWTYLGSDDGMRDAAETVPGPTVALLAEKARQHGVYIHGGSIVERIPGDPRLANTTVMIDPNGDVLATYRKIHLFDVDLDGVAAYRESATISPGDAIVTVDVDGVTVGLAICYDLRFPELFRILSLQGAEVIMLPAAFTMTTGKDHWEVLIRARAIENGVFMIAPGQSGQYAPAYSTGNGASANGDERRQSAVSAKWSYGRSMIVDPWGIVLATAPDQVTVISADLDISRVEHIRRQVPSLANRRPSAYRWPEMAQELTRVGD